MDIYTVILEKSSYVKNFKSFTKAREYYYGNIALDPILICNTLDTELTIEEKDLKEAEEIEEFYQEQLNIILQEGIRRKELGENSTERQIIKWYKNDEPENKEKIKNIKQGLNPCGSKRWFHHEEGTSYGLCNYCFRT